VDAVITIASGCGAVLADSGKHDDTGTERRLRILDIHQFLADVALPESMTLAPLPVTIAVQDPCSLRNALRAEQAVYELLGRIPDVRIVPLAENHLCCGGAGAYPLRQPAMAELLRADKLAHLRQLQPAVLATQPRLRLHLGAGLRGLDIGSASACTVQTAAIAGKYNIEQPGPGLSAPNLPVR
jgi:glycolate oxidase iron-sulfur subunit